MSYHAHVHGPGEPKDFPFRMAYGEFASIKDVQSFIKSGGLNCVDFLHRFNRGRDWDWYIPEDGWQYCWLTREVVPTYHSRSFPGWTVKVEKAWF